MRILNSDDTERLQIGTYVNFHIAMLYMAYQQEKRKKVLK